MPSRSRARVRHSLGEFLREPHVDDLPIPLVELGDQRCQGVEVLDQFQRLVFAADEVRAAPIEEEL
ncbi:hypothetical protein SAMN06272765_9106 [Streptomyces sp. Ag109_G2-15]|nr:hypothetical protein SAMN06272765_9106 [Streptomyces sp. Ag109_G2-15]